MIVRKIIGGRQLATVHSKNKGMFLVIISTILWAINGNIGAYLFKYKEITPGHLTFYRLIFTGLILIIYEFITNRSEVFSIFKNKKESLILIYFAFFGALTMQYSYFVAIQYSNAATATTLQNLSPFIIVVITSIWYRKLPSKNIILSLGLALVGAFLIVTHGKFNQLAITKPALVFGLLASIGYVNYTLSPISLQAKYNTSLIMGWAMLLAGIGFGFVFNPMGSTIIMDSITILSFGYVIILGTLFPFLFYSLGVKNAGAQIASILSLIEPVASAIIGVIFLGESFKRIDLIGISLVICALYLLSKGKKPPDKSSELRNFKIYENNLKILNK